MKIASRVSLFFSTLFRFTVVALCLSQAQLSHAEFEEINMQGQRLKGFRAQQDEEKKWNVSRDKGMKDYFAEQQAAEEAKRKALADFLKNRKKKNDDRENSPDALADAAEKRKELKQMGLAREQFRQQKAKALKQAQSAGISETEELGLDQQRPRYAFNRRVLYGSRSKWKINSKGNSPTTNSSGFNSDLFGGNSNGFPPPNGFEGFDDTLPPPMPLDGFEGGDFSNQGLPPPPPPIYGGDGSYDGGYFPPQQAPADYGNPNFGQPGTDYVPPAPFINNSPDGAGF